MRIISKFHDYYDSAMAYGHDENGYVYLRHQTTLPKDEAELVIPEEFHKSTKYRAWNSGQLYVRKMGIGFCGKLYPMFVLRDPRTHGVYHYFHTPEELRVFVETYLDKSYYNELTKPKTYSKCYRRYGTSREKSKLDKLQSFYDKWNEFELMDPFIKFKVPLFTYAITREDYSGDYVVVLNDVLSYYKFFKVFDAYTAYQEIDMFLSGVIGNTEDNMVQIDDKTMRDQKGFDDYSFKKLPTKTRK